MKLLLRAYPRRWRDRYGEELLALLGAGPPTPRVRVNVLLAGLEERLRDSGPALCVLWAWSLFAVGGMAFQKSSEHWQVVVPGGDRGLPTAALDTAQVVAAVGSAAVLAGVALALPAFLRDLRSGGWPALRRPILIAAAATAVAAAALVSVEVGHDLIAVSVFVASAVVSLFAWTHAAALAARRLEPLRAHSYLALIVSATMLVMAVAVAVWLGSVMPQAPSFISAAQLAVVATFMLAGMTLAAAGGIQSLRA